jgi:type IV conjugative transfer system protein TraE
MNPDRQLTDITAVAAALKRQQLITLAIVVLAVLLAVHAMGKQTTVILEPPTRTKAIAVVGDRVDAAWLEEMGAWVAHMMLDASPHSIAWQHEQLLKWVHPSAHGHLQQDMAVQAKRLVDTNASTMFWLQQVAPDAEHTRVALIGQLDTYVNGVKVPGSSRTQAYLVQFESRGGRMLIKDWREVPGDDIWLTKAMAQAEKARLEEQQRQKQQEKDK